MVFSRNVVICLTVLLSLSILSVAQPNRRLPIPLKPDSKPNPTTNPDSEPDGDLFSELDEIAELAYKPKPAPAPAALANPTKKPSQPPNSTATKPSQHQKPATAPASPPKAAPKPASNSKPTPKSESGKKPGSAKSPSPKPALPRKPPPKSPESDDEVPVKTNPPSIFPYQTVNNFCLYKRLHVHRPFCLKVLKNPKAADASSYTPLLQVTVEALSNHIAKTSEDFQTLFKDKKTKPDVKSAIQECVSVYREITGYIKLVLSDAIQESAIAGLDGEVIGEDINRCVKAVSKINDADIHESNKISKEYAKLLSDIADNSEV